MNFTPLTKAEQRIAHLIALSGERSLTDEESDDLYRALHADYCRKWRAARKAADERRRDIARSCPTTERDAILLRKLRREREAAA